MNVATSERKTTSNPTESTTGGAGSETKPKRKTVTNWNVFEKTGVVPTRISCNGYLGSHPAELSCHSNLIPTSTAVLRHMNPEHSGGWFFFRLRQTDAKGKNPIWRELEEAGVEIQHIYCPHCRADVQMTPRALLYHMGPHPGANRVNTHPQTVCMTLGFNSPDQIEGMEDEEEMYE